MVWIILVILLIIVASGVRIVPQARAMVVERLGAYHRTMQTGLHYVIPFVERIASNVSLKEIVQDFAPQPVITEDNVTMQIDTVVYYSITDPKLYTYGVESPISAIENLTATTLRNIIGDLELDETLTSRDIINSKMRAILDEATDPWGIKVTQVEVKNIIPPRDIQEAMEKQMRAERERREAILKAEGEKKAAILIAEGEKESAILRADAKKEAQWVLKQIKNYDIELPIAFDWENWSYYNDYHLSFFNLTSMAESFVDEVEKAGYDGMIYSSKTYLENMWMPLEDDVWLAHYTDSTTYKGDYKMWQVCENGKVDGISGMVDINILYLDK